MTDKELDNKLAAAFDNVRADSSVKARIRKGLTGDVMENNKIIVSSTAKENSNTDKIKVKRRGRIAAAVIAGVLAVGGGSYLLKGGFDWVTPHSDSSAAYTDFIESALYEKFGYYSDIWKLPNGRFLIKQSYDDYGEIKIPDDYEWCENHYFIFDPVTESVIGDEIVSNFCSVEIYENCIGIWYVEQPQNPDTPIKIKGSLFDFDLNPIKENIRFDLNDSQIPCMPMVSDNNDIYIAGLNYETDKEKLSVYDIDGNTIYESDVVYHIDSCTLAKCGKYFYYTIQDEDDEAEIIKGIAISDGYTDCEHTDSIYNSDSVTDEYEPLYFDIGKYLYTVYYTESGKQMIRRIDMTGEEELYFGEPEDVINYVGFMPEYYYVSNDGKYLFTCSLDNLESSITSVNVYDIENNFKKVYEKTMDEAGRCFTRDGCNLLFNEASGNVCIGDLHETGANTPRLESTLCFNIFGKEYPEFDIKNIEKNDTTDTTDTTNTADTSDAAHYFNGEAVDELPVSNEELGFDPDAEKIEDKFGSALWRLSNGNYMGVTYFNEHADEIGIIEYLNFYVYIYESDTNSIKSVFIGNVEESGLIHAEENCISYFKRKENAKTDTDYTFELYDLDLAPIENSTFSFDAGRSEPKLLITPDNKSYIFGSDSCIYDSNGSVIHKIENSGYFFQNIKISKNGKCIYYASAKDNTITLHTVSLDDGYAYAEYTYETYKDWELPLYFDSGKYLYLVFGDKDGKQQFRRIDMTGDEEPVYGTPEDELVFDEMAGDNNGDQCNTFVTKDGKYLFLSNTGEYSSELRIYDIENEFKKVYETNIDSRIIRRDGMNILYDETTGDVCLNSSHNNCFNLFGNKYSNLGLS
ncbi:hypothetical protein [Ruminococcus albus]|uniref:Uncharacterized protein n=1 Tax=Ruminococcus albus TaxID=1264 RepID=A0A1I1N0F9_RUMAL|nr:hypothetical protein [Ruminococcus albus]SFC90836.1 hypothetical protein SAMN02910406_02634 [Ruminococcus albus]